MEAASDLRQETGNFGISSNGYILKMVFTQDTKEIAEMVKHLITDGIERVKIVLSYKKIAVKGFKLKTYAKNFFNPFYWELACTKACIKKASEGTEKLNKVPLVQSPGLANLILWQEKELKELKEVWLPQLEAVIKGKRRKNYIVAGLLVILHIAFYTLLFNIF